MPPKSITIPWALFRIPICIRVNKLASALSTARRHTGISYKGKPGRESPEYTKISDHDAVKLKK
jgi:hypothetical protein